MTELSRSPQADTPSLQGLAVYNPHLLNRDDVLATFVARTMLLDQLTESLRRGIGGVKQHHLVLGQRGMGKTTLLRRLAIAVAEEPALDGAYLPLSFPEEQYNVTSLSRFYLNCLDALLDLLETRGCDREVAEIEERLRQVSSPGRQPREGAANTAVLERDTLGLLKEYAAKLGKTLLLLVDNVDQVLGGLTQEEQWAWREQLADRDGRLLLVGASVTCLEDGFRYEKPFYEFLRLHYLEPLTESEAREVLLRLAERHAAPRVAELVKASEGRVRTLYQLSGGNPRTIVLLFEILAQNPDRDVRAQLELALDRSTPLYKARFEELPAQAQAVLDALATRWDPASAAEVAEQAHLQTTLVSSQLARLVKQGLVEKVPIPPNSRTGFQISERFFNIWYLMRSSRRLRRRLIWLVEFMRMLYEPSELCEQAANWLRSFDQGARASLWDVEQGFVLAGAVDEAPLRHALTHQSIRLFCEDPKLRASLGGYFDFAGDDADLRPLAERQAALGRIRDQVFGVDPKWDGWDAERFWSLLTGSTDLSLPQKERLAAALVTMTAADIQELSTRLEQADARQRERLGTAAWSGVKEALIRGIMTSPADVEGARAAVYACQAPLVLVVAVCLAPADRVTQEAADEAFELAQRSGEVSAFLWRRLGRLFAVLNATQSQSPELAGRNVHVAFCACARAVELQPGDRSNADAWNDVGSALFSRNRYEEAAQAFRKTIELEPSDADAWHALGAALGRLDRFREAEQPLRKTIELNAADPNAWQDLGLALALLKRPEEAEHALRKSIELDPTGAYSWRGLGIVLDRLNRYDEAEHALRKAIELQPENGQWWSVLGDLSWDKLKKYDEALAAYHEAAARARDHAYPRNRFAWCCYLLGRDLDEAARLAREAVALEPDNPRFQHTLACVLARQRLWHESAVAAQRFLQHPEHWGAARFGHVVSFFAEVVKLGRVADGLELLEQTGLAERWRPLYEALLVHREGSDLRLQRLAPEVRGPTQEVVARLKETPGVEVLP